MDSTDRKILAILQEDASMSVADIAKQVNLSQTPCWRRIQKLADSGVITRRVALVDPDAIGLGLTVFVEIETGDHSKEWLERFAAAIAEMPEVMEIYRMAGDVDYMMRISVPNMAGCGCILSAVDRAGATQKCDLALRHGARQIYDGLPARRGLGSALRNRRSRLRRIRGLRGSPRRPGTGPRRISPQAKMRSRLVR